MIPALVAVQQEWQPCGGKHNQASNRKDRTPADSIGQSTGRLSTIPRVPWPPREFEPTFDGALAPRGLTGYLVDLDVQ